VQAKIESLTILWEDSWNLFCHLRSAKSCGPNWQGRSPAPRRPRYLCYLSALEIRDSTFLPLSRSRISSTYLKIVVTSAKCRSEPPSRRAWCSGSHWRYESFEVVDPWFQVENYLFLPKVFQRIEKLGNEMELFRFQIPYHRLNFNLKVRFMNLLNLKYFLTYLLFSVFFLQLKV